MNLFYNINYNDMTMNDIILFKNTTYLLLHYNTYYDAGIQQRYHHSFVHILIWINEHEQQGTTATV